MSVNVEWCRTYQMGYITYGELRFFLLASDQWIERYDLTNVEATQGRMIKNVPTFLKKNRSGKSLNGKY